MARAIVIGSGFGGLAAAARLGARGYDVTVLEKLDAPGGRAYVYRQDGYTFDAGPTIITAPYLFEELWQACGRRLADDVTLRALDPFYEVRFHDGDVFRYTADLAAMREQIARIEPRDVAGFDRFLELVQGGAGFAATRWLSFGLQRGVALLPQRQIAHPVQFSPAADRR